MLGSHFGNIHNRRKLRHPDTCHNAGGTDRAGANADFQRVRATINQRFGGITRSNITGHNLDFIAAHFLDTGHHIQHAF